MLSWICDLLGSTKSLKHKHAKELAQYKKKLARQLELTSSIKNQHNQLLSMVTMDNMQLVTEASKLYITDHAIFRYRERFSKQGTDEELRAILYKLVLKHLVTMDKLQDGRYDLDRNIVGKIVGNTLVTVIPRGKR